MISPPYTLSQSFFFLLRISYSILLSYNSINLFLCLLLFAHLLLKVWLWEAIIFIGKGFFFFLSCFVFPGSNCITPQKMLWAVRLSVSQPEGKMKEQPKKKKRQLQQVSPHNWHRRHLMSIQLKISRRLYHRSETIAGHTMKTGSQST